MPASSLPLKSSGDVTEKNTYRTLIVAMVILLVAGIIGLSLVLYGHGPRVRMIRFDADPSKTSLTKHSSLKISFDRPLKPMDYKEQILFFPPVDFTSQVSAQSITVTFNENLAANTEYTVSIGPYIYDQTGKPMRDNRLFSFSTEKPYYAYLERNYGFSGTQTGDDADDYVKIARLGDPPTTVFAHPHITSFVANNRFIVVAVHEDANDELYIITRDDNREIRMQTQLAGRIGNLTLSPRGNIALYTITPDFDSLSPDEYAQYANQVESVNLQTHESTVLRTAEGKPLKAYYIDSDADGQAVVVQNEAQLYFAVSPFNDFDPILIGSHSQSYGFDDSNNELIFRDDIDFIRHDSTSGNTQTAQLLTDDYIYLLTPNEGHLFAASRAYDTAGAKTGIREYENWNDINSKLVWQDSTDDKQTLRDFSLSYDNSLLALELGSDNCQYDDESPNNQCKDAHIILHDIYKNEAIEYIAGFDLIWLP